MKWIPNALSVSRIILAPFIVISAVHHNWPAAFWLLLISLATDFFDGMLAKKLHAETEFGKKILDPVSDAVMSAAAVGGLVLQSHVLRNIFFIALPIIITGLIIKFFKHQTYFPKLKRLAIPLLPVCEVIMLIILLLVYANRAFPAQIIFVYIITGILIPIIIYIKRHRVSDWFSGRL